MKLFLHDTRVKTQFRPPHLLVASVAVAMVTFTGLPPLKDVDSSDCETSLVLCFHRLSLAV